MFTHHLKSITLKTLQKAIQRALALDPSSSDKIRALENKQVKMIIAPLSTSFFIVFKDGHLVLQADSNVPPNTTIHSSPLGLIRLSLLPASRVRSLFNDKIRISGDVILGQQVKNLFDSLDIDWEGHLAHFTGDMVAYQIGSFVRQGIGIKRQVSASFRQNVSDYVHDECRLFPSQQETEDFYEDVNALMLDVDRLEARLRRFKPGEPNWHRSDPS